MKQAKTKSNGNGRASSEIRPPFDADFLARLEGLHLIAKRLAGRVGAGQRRSQRLGDGLEFADHRDYVPGDDIRYIDWPYYGRMDKLLLRLFHEHSEGAVTIMLDCSASMGPAGEAGKFDYARKVAAALAYVAMGSLERVRIAPFAAELGEIISAGRNRSQILTVMDFLSDLTASGTTSLARATAEIARRDAPGDAVMLISDLLGCEDQLDDCLARLRGAGMDVVVIHVVSPADAEPDLQGTAVLADSETNQRIPVTITDSIMDSYRKTWLAFRNGCQSCCRKRGAVHMAAETDQPPERLLLQTLRRAGVVGLG